MFLIGISGQSGGFDPLILLLAGIVIEAFIGHLSNFRNWMGSPSHVMSRYVYWCNDKLNRDNRSQGDRAIRGGVALLLLAILSGGFGWAVAILSQKIQLFWILEVALIVLFINQRGTHANVKKLSRSLRNSDLKAAQNNVLLTIYDNVDGTDADKMAALGLEICANAMTRNVVAPVFWYILFGLPGLLIFQSVAVQEQIIGKQTKKYHAFGFTAARLSDILQFVPARIAGLLIVIGAIFVPTATPRKALMVMLRDSSKHCSTITGWPLSAMVGALRLTISNNHKPPGQPTIFSWIGDGRAKITPRDISLGLYLFSVSCLLNTAIVAGLTTFRNI